MNVLWFILPLSLLFSMVAVAVFIKAALAGQWDDLDTPASKILIDGEPIRRQGETK